MSYLQIISGLFGNIPEFVSAFREVKELQKGQRGLTHLVMAELELNISLLLDDYLKGGIAPEKIIAHLQITHLQKAMDQDFDFHKLSKKKLSYTDIPEDFYLKKLDGYDSRKLFRKIYVKIQELKRVPELYPQTDPDKIRLPVRLKNLLKLLLITAKLLQKSS